MPEPSILDARLAEIDERLRALQSGLDPLPDADPGEAPGAFAPPPAPPAPTPLRSAPPPPEAFEAFEPPSPATSPRPAESERLLAELRELSGAHQRLLELHRELLSQYADGLERRAAQGASARLTAGPFADGGAVRDFTRALSGLAGVAAVDVREYLAGDRVAFEVRLSGA